MDARQIDIHHDCRDADPTPYAGNGWRNDRDVPRDRNIYEVHVHRDDVPVMCNRTADGSEQPETSPQRQMG
jgi:hypothetical protein